MAVEVLVEGCERPRETLLAIDASSEKPWLQAALKGVILLDQPFAVQFQTGPEAEEFAGRMRTWGFRCKVGSGPDPSQRVTSEERRC